MTFTESNTVEQMILDTAITLGGGAGQHTLREDSPPGWDGSLAKRCFGVVKSSQLYIKL